MTLGGSLAIPTHRQRSWASVAASYCVNSVGSGAAQAAGMCMLLPRAGSTLQGRHGLSTRNSVLIGNRGSYTAAQKHSSTQTYATADTPQIPGYSIYRLSILQAEAQNIHRPAAICAGTAFFFPTDLWCLWPGSDGTEVYGRLFIP